MANLKKSAAQIKSAHNEHVPGDTKLVGLNAEEYEKVVGLLGQPTINPDTKLPQWGYGADTPGGRNEGAGGKPDKDKSDGGGNGKGGGQDGKGGGKKEGQGSVSPGGTQAEIDKEFGDLGKPGVKSPNATPAQQDMPGVYTNDMGITVQRTPIAQKNLMDAVAEYNDVTIGDFLGGMIGLGSLDPVTDPNFNAATMNEPNMSIDALGLGLGIGGLVAGVPFAGQIPNALKEIGAIPEDFGEIGIGQPPGATAPEGSGSLPDGTTVDGPVDTDPTGGDDTQGGGGDPAGNDHGGMDGNVLAPKIDGKPKAQTTTDDALDSGSDLPTVEPLSGLGIDILTQTSGSTTDVNVKTPAQRRRRGSLGGLGVGGGLGI